MRLLGWAALLPTICRWVQASFAQLQEDYGTIEKSFAEVLGRDAAGQQAPKKLHGSRP